MWQIVSMVCLVVAMLSPLVSYAQIDAAALARAQREQQRSGQMGGMNNGQMGGMYGAPGMDGMEGEEGEQTDTTDVKEKRERKPLESYYFSDTVRALPNWKWNIDEAMSVSITPGATAFTVMPRFASSTASAFTAPITPAFAAE